MVGGRIMPTDPPVCSWRRRPRMRRLGKRVAPTTSASCCPEALSLFVLELSRIDRINGSNGRPRRLPRTGLVRHCLFGRKAGIPERPSCRRTRVGAARRWRARRHRRATARGRSSALHRARRRDSLEGGAPRRAPRRAGRRQQRCDQHVEAPVSVAGPRPEALSVGLRDRPPSARAAVRPNDK